MNRTGNVYGQVWIGGQTDQGGPTASLIAQLGYGPDGSNPEGNAAWTWVDQGMTVMADRVTISQRDRAARIQDPGAIKQWIVLAPVPLNGVDAVTAFGEEQIPGESQLRPRAGESLRVGEEELVWSTARQADPLIDFSEILGVPGRSSATS